MLLELLKTSFDLRENSGELTCNVGIWQGLADDDPDVDAIYRLTSDQECIFNSDKPVVLSENTVCPFNSQNTAIRKELFALLYLPTSVTFRFTDILRGLVAQPIMWAAGYKLGFTEATVVQERNPHNLLKDFESEIPMFLRGQDVVSIVNEVIDKKNSIVENLQSAYWALLVERIVSSDEKKHLMPG
ncbi:STELLO glycosyltransferase family protein [Ruegeria sp. AU67]|uniref:STELLO glycosyltransferase family protein n=1 Tax=Ruegeria sp. AU67 TaxID=2108530 RepID=UPI001359A542|nr:STELLO glycosyltransferase family protein [Ruegeria sp. AU67]